MKQTRENTNWKTRLKQAALIVPISILMAGFQNCGEGFEGSQPEINSQGEMIMKFNADTHGGNAEPAGSFQQGYRLQLVKIRHHQGDHIVDQYVAVKGPQGTLAKSRNNFHITLMTRNHPYKVIKDPYKKQVKFAFLIRKNNAADRLVQLIYDGNYREIGGSEGIARMGNLLNDYGVNLKANTTLNDLQGLKVHRWEKVETLFIGKTRTVNKDISIRGGKDIKTFYCSNSGGNCAQSCTASQRLGWDGTCRSLVQSCNNNTGTRTWNPRTNAYGACITTPAPQPPQPDTPSTGDPCVLIPGYDNTAPIMGVYGVTSDNGTLTCVPGPNSWDNGFSG